MPAAAAMIHLAPCNARLQQSDLCRLNGRGVQADMNFLGNPCPTIALRNPLAAILSAHTIYLTTKQQLPSYVLPLWPTLSPGYLGLPHRQGGHSSPASHTHASSFPPAHPSHTFV